jgi:hypothetical protein
MLNSQQKIIGVDTNTGTVCAYLGATGCSCTCASCQGCVDCTSCPGLSVGSIVMKMYRKGVNYLCGGSAPTPQSYPNCALPPSPANGPCPTPAAPNVGPPPIYFLTYPAYTLTGQVVCFFIDSQLTGLCSGRYVGDIFVAGNPCGSIEMNVGNQCTVFSPYTVNTGSQSPNTFQPS